MSAPSSLTVHLRREQEADEVFGPFFTALHTFASRTINTFFSDTPDLPHPVVALDKVRASCKGEYRPKDGLMLAHRITVDPFKCTTGLDVAEVLAHELCHLWQHHVGRLPERNYHNAEFHSRAGLLGLLTSGKRGHHDGYIEGGVWQDWLEQNSDLNLDKFILPDDEDAKRRLYKYECPSCGASFRSRRTEMNVQCNECDEPFVFVG